MAILPENFRQARPSFAVLDAAGVIVDVNPEWRDFGRSEGLKLPEEGIGRNYLDYCTAPDAAAVARRIRDLLEHRTDRIAFLYPCHSPAHRRWFVMIGLPSRGNASTGRVTLFHIEVTGLLASEVDPLIHPALLGLDTTLPLSDDDTIVALLTSSLAG